MFILHFFYSTLFVCFILIDCVYSQDDHKITESKNFNDFRGVVAIFENLPETRRKAALDWAFKCTAGLISTTHVITTAQCCIATPENSDDTISLNQLENDQIRVRAGNINYNHHAVHREVAAINIHPDFTNNENLDFDISVIVLAIPFMKTDMINPLPFNYLIVDNHTVCEIRLLHFHFNCATNASLFEFETPTHAKLVRQVQVVDAEQCAIEGNLKKEEVENRFCVLEPESKDEPQICRYGYMGTPVICNDMWAGVLSHSKTLTGQLNKTVTRAHIITDIRTYEKWLLEVLPSGGIMMMPANCLSLNALWLFLPIIQNNMFLDVR